MDLAKRIEILGKITQATFNGSIAARSVAQNCDYNTLAVINPLIVAFDELIEITKVQNFEIGECQTAIANKLTHIKREAIQDCIEKCNEYLKNFESDSAVFIAISDLRNKFQKEVNLL
jgi:hypothetical protein